ncbi:SNF2 family N-terminal domain-containing protein [Kalaharituber pfeilii]|nr:SNF2 family N-terminal domain-containing protein [Kalaharituber pfeilii]
MPPMHSDEDVSDHESSTSLRFPRARGKAFTVQIPEVHNREEYEIFADEFRVRAILEERMHNGELYYITKFGDGHVAEIPFETLIAIENGPEAYSLYTPESYNLRSNHKKSNKAYEDDLFFYPGSDAGAHDKALQTTYKDNASLTGKRKTEQTYNAYSSEDQSPAPKKRSRRASRARSTSSSVQVVSVRTRGKAAASLSLELETLAPRTRRTLRSSGVKQRRMLSYRIKQPDEETDVDTMSSSDIVYSDLLPKQPKRSKGSSYNSKTRIQSESSDDDQRTRRSGRTSHRKITYKEPALDEDDDFVENSVPVKAPKPKAIGPKERFPIYDDDDEFVQFHSQTCDTCQRTGDNPEAGPLIYCQGCSYSYHKMCIGHRAAREHLVTRISEDSYVLQCRRCIGRPRMKDNTAPCQDRCTQCRQPGRSCLPFKPMKQGKKVGSEDEKNPEVEMSPDLINNPDNLLFRCTTCRRGYHFEHLPSRSHDPSRASAKHRLREYSKDWKCLDCVTTVHKIQAIVAWRPADQSQFIPELSIDDFNDDEREYLVKFEGTSYFRAKWMPGPWVFGLVNGPMRITFCKNKPLPKLTFEDAVDPEFLSVEIILDAKYTSYVPMGKDAEVDLARVKEVTTALVKYRGLTYDDVVWEEPPQIDSGQRWEDFRAAYDDYIHGFYIHLPKGMQKKIEKVRTQNFEQLERKKQPKYIVGGTLMDYQKEGMNWLYYKWWKGENAILADEMGLGKTIQIISFLSLLHQEHKIWPFLIVVPHSTVPNWKREIRLWNPSLRVVAYFGSKEARKLSRHYEMFHPGGRDLKCHIVVTSYTTPIDDMNILKAIPWEGLIVDEGQRLKNDGSLLYKALSTFNIRHKVLLTGTPLQNNPRELFNLLQFLDPKDMKASDLEEKFGVLTKENVPELHALIRPYFLRRTKAQVLTMLPPMAEIIVPVTMTKLQKKLYKSILAKDAALIKAILSKGGNLKNTERAKLGNILMQLRKCLCHPFIYSDDIEEKVDDEEISQKNLVEASAKLELLNLMLPKLKERGHRVLIFSQFLGMLDVARWAVSSQEKQKRIDAYNAPNSELFAFLLSTRAGGVGINLATADTVIILDPDFNPHQDLQALSRAHRIGQKKKVLVFHLMTRDTAEEKIIQLGKKKLSLDHLIIEKMDADKDEEVDVESILKFGAGKLFDDTVEDKEIRYDSASMDALLDRSQVEQTTSQDSKENSTELAFSFARVWANDQRGLVDDGFGDGDHMISESTWDKILQEREAEARREREEEARKEQLGRGKRTRVTLTNYAAYPDAEGDSGSDTDFQAPADQQSDSDFDVPEGEYEVISEAMNLQLASPSQSGKGPARIGSAKPRASAIADPFVRRPSVPPVSNINFQPILYKPPVEIPVSLPPSYPTSSQHFQLPPLQYHHQHHIPQSQLQQRPIPAQHPAFQTPHPGLTQYINCIVCKKVHTPGQCPFHLAGVEHCPLCGIAHFGKGPICPHIGSETQIRAMMETLRQSMEDPALVSEAVRYLRGRIGELRRRKKMALREAETTAAASMVGVRVAAANAQVPMGPQNTSAVGKIQDWAAQDVMVID